jgi:hypothetical protein
MEHDEAMIRSEIERLLDRMAKADDDQRLLGYARQIRFLLCAIVSGRHYSE